MRLLAAMFVVPLALAAQVPNASAHACGSVSVTFSDGFEGSAARIHATGIGCEGARRVARACLRDTLRGWNVRQDKAGQPQPRYVLTRGGMVVSLSVAGGGGCFHFP